MKNATDIVIAPASAANRVNNPSTSRTEHTTSAKTAIPQLTSFPTPSGSGNPLAIFDPPIAFPHPCSSNIESPNHNRKTNNAKSTLVGKNSSLNIDPIFFIQNCGSKMQKNTGGRNRQYHPTQTNM